MKTSEQINELAAALAKAQGSFTNPERNRKVKVKLKTGGEYEFYYTTIDRIIEMIRKPMAENGLSFAHSVTLDQEWAIVTTRIMHASGQWIEDELPVKPDGFGPQQVGSAITYGKRYSLSALLGVASDEDDDGNLGSGHTSEPLSPPVKSDQPSKSYKAAIEKIAAAVRAHDVNEVARILNVADEAHDNKKLSDVEHTGITNECSLALKKIDALKNQPDMAAA